MDIDKLDPKTQENKITTFVSKLKQLESGIESDEFKKPLLVFDESDAIEFDPEKF